MSKKGLLLKIFDILINLFYVTITIVLFINIVKLSNIENFIRVFVLIFIILLLLVLVKLFKKKPILFRIIIIFLCIFYSLGNYAFYRVYSSLDNITTNVDTKVLCLVTSLEDVKDIDNISNGKIGVLKKGMDVHFDEFVSDVVKVENLDNLLVEYDDYLGIIKSLLNKEIDYAFLPENYNDIYNNNSNERVELQFNVLYKGEKVIELENNSEIKNVDEPFSMLLIGTDVITDSYNADTLLVMTVNPKNMNVTMLSIPRDTYATIACTGGKHKINASGWYGDKCVVKTIEKYLDIKIDYYAKINFFGIVDLVDKLGGVEIDVPYPFCEQNSKREFGNNMIFVEEGKQTLNGEQALALSRNRHYWKDICPPKYTSLGDRSDLTRGKNQQLVIEGIANKIVKIRNLDTFYNIMDSVSKNMSTNMSKETILSFYNLGKEIIKKLNSSSISEVVNIDKLSLKSYFANIYLSGLELSTIVNYQESINYVSMEMKKNLGLLEKEEIKKFSFDINDSIDEDIIKYKSLTSNLKLLPNFVGKTIGEVINYCNINGLKCESNFKLNTDVVIMQSIHANTDISTIGGKIIVFDVEGVKNNYNDEIDDKDDTVVDDENVDVKDNGEELEKDEEVIPPLNDKKEEGYGDLIEDESE